jgi:aspartyl-tRNA(Asn)/glutamyl-tRNA(Gln) amidotransferase subunit C
MISEKDVKKIAVLARIEISDEELKKMTADFGRVLEYVSQLRGVADSGEKIKPSFSNVFREDQHPDTPGEFSEGLLALAPKLEDRYIAIEKIINRE